jgi:hypothetical protein
VDRVDTTLKISEERRHLYRIYFADGSVGTRHFDEPLRVGQQILDRGNRHLISTIEREPDYGIGSANAVLAPAARAAA